MREGGRAMREEVDSRRSEMNEGGREMDERREGDE